MTQEDDLIERAKAGDEEAFCSLARTYQRRIYALALHYTRDPHEAEDLSQEAWLKAYRALGSFRGESSFYTWLRQITINTFLNRRRETKTMFNSKKQAIRLGQMVSLDELVATPADHSPGPEERLHRRLMTEKVMEGLSELTAQQHLIFILKHREEMTYEEIARACSISTGTVKKALFRAVSRLRKYLGIKPGATDEISLTARERR